MLFWEFSAQLKDRWESVVDSSRKTEALHLLRTFENMLIIHFKQCWIVCGRIAVADIEACNRYFT